MANTNLGHVNYSLSMKPTKPGDADSPKKIYASIQSDETVSLSSLAQHMSEHNTPFSAGTILGVLRDFVSCVTELLRQGYSITIDDLAKIYLTATCKPSDTVQEFNPAQDITRLNVRFSPSDTVLAKVNTDIDWNFVMTREQQAEAKKQAKLNLPQSEGSTNSGSDNQGGNSGGNDDNAEGQTE